MRSNQDLSPHAHLEREWHVNRRLDGLAEAIVTGVGHYSDDPQPLIAFGSRLRERGRALQLREPELFSQGVAVGPIGARQSLVDHRQSRATHDFRMLPDTPLQQWYAEDRKIFRADEIRAQ